MGRITIIGLGKLGTSIGLALRQAKLNNEIIGHDREFSAASAAKRAGALDKAEWNLPASLENAGLVVIATPLGAIEQVMKEIAPHLTPGAVVTDIAASKLPVMRWAEEHLPDTVSFVGGHPILARSTKDQASANLFEGSTYTICPSPDVTENAVELVCGMVSVLGAKTLFLDPAEHDSLMTLTDHLPVLTATALARVVLSSPSWRETGRMATAVFRDSVVLVEGDPASRREMVMNNREDLLRGISAMEEQLRNVRAIVEEGNPEQIEEFFEGAREELLRWEVQSQKYDGSQEAEIADTMGSMTPVNSLSQMIFGGSKTRDRLFGRGKKTGKK